MRRILVTAASAAVLFGAGFGAARLIPPAQAATMPAVPQLIDLATLTAADLPSPAPNAKVVSKMYLSQDGATVAVQIGTVPKHFHADANEVQYVVDGTGTEWLGDKEITLRPGVMLVIPKGTAHGGTTETTGHLKIIAIKTPPQAADDVHLVP